MSEERELIRSRCQAALQALMNIKCKIDDEGCDGPWCSARQKINVAFKLRSEVVNEAIT